MASINILVIINRQQPAVAAATPSTSISTHAIFVFIVTVFVSLLQIKFPETLTSSPFQTHHTTVMAFIASLISYCSSLWATKIFPSYACIFRVTMRSAGLFTLASLVSLLLPGSCHRVSYMIFIFYFIWECFHLCQMLRRLIFQQAIHGSVSGMRQGQTQALLPLTFMDLPPVN